MWMSNYYAMPEAEICPSWCHILLDKLYSMLYTYSVEYSYSQGIRKDSPMQPQFSVVYLLHFDQPIGDPTKVHGQASHYLGYADRLDRRLEQHFTGKGAKITQAVVKAGISMQLAQTWHGSRWFERKLKNRKNAKRLCPICQGQVQQQVVEVGARLDALL
jgi:predicted GIY-YIG superfamily endonuclease